MTGAFARCLAVVALGAAAQADPGQFLGGGNIHVRGDAAKFQALKTVGAGMCRVPVDGRAYWNGKAATPEKADAAILMAHGHGITPMLLFEYYTRWHGPVGDYAKWHAIGKAFAERFGPNSAWLVSKGIRDWGVTFYSAVNEPMWRSNNPEPIPPAQYARALEGLADGVHAADPELKVSPGGFQEVPLFGNRNPFIKAVAPLYNQGKLHAIDIHRYWDVKYVPMDRGANFSLHRQFAQVKRHAGITADVRFYTTEMNFKKRLVTEDEAAKGFLTALWDAMTVVGNEGQRVTEFVLPWNIFNLAEKDEHYGLCTRLSPWTPTARGRVLQTVCRLTRGMEIVSCDPRKTGVTILEGNGRKMWVWQNRTGWTDRPGTSFEVSGILEGTIRIHVHAWDGLRKSVPVRGTGPLTITGLGQGETFMFLSVRGQPGAPQ